MAQHRRKRRGGKLSICAAVKKVKDGPDKKSGAQGEKGRKDMRLRNRRVMSIVLAASMVFSMNTAAFAEEIPAEVAAEAAEETAVEAEAVAEEETAGAEETAEVEEVAGAEEEAVGAEMQSKDAGIQADDTSERESQGVWYQTKDGVEKPLTTITYESNGDKKNPVDNIVTMENVTDPVSWNGSYAKRLIQTAVYGFKDTDGHVANGSAVTVSNGDAITGSSYYPAVEGVYPCDEVSENVIEVDKTNGYYIFMCYGIPEGDGVRYVEGFTDPMPVTFYDGRSVEYNKSGNYKKSTSKKEVLDVDATLVKYTAGTDGKGKLEEIAGLEVASVKVDKKNKVNTVASVSGDQSRVVDDEKTNKGHLEYKVLNGATIPTFTFSVKLKNKNEKNLAKQVKTVDKALKSVTFPFAIKQFVVDVFDKTTVTYDYWYTKEGKDDAADFGVQEVLNPNYDKVSDNRAAYVKFGSDEDSYNLSSIDDVYLNISKVNIKNSKAKATLAFNYSDIGDTAKGNKTGSKTISSKNEYTFTAAGSGDTAYAVLDFADGGNFQYREIDEPHTTDSGRSYDSDSSIAPLGFQWAFRMSPTDKKKFRVGFYKDATNMFVD